MDTPASPSPPSPFEKAVIGHLSIYVVMATWMFGGRIYWAYLPLVSWGALGGVLTLILWWRARGRRWRHALCLLPLGLLVTQMLVSLRNPSFAEFYYYEQLTLRPVDHISWLPSSAYPASTWHDLLLYVGLYLSAYNLFLGVRTRRSLRNFAMVAVINGGVLAVFGTVQKLVGAGLFFGLQDSPNPAFFASFIYHNHWAAYAVLTAALGLALAAHYFRRDRAHDWMRSPAFSLTLPVVLLILSIPLSTSRSGTLLVLVLGAGVLIHAQQVLRRHTRGAPFRRLQLNLALAAVSAVVLGAGYYLGKPIIQQRLRDTVRQIEMREHYAFRKSDQVFYGQARLMLYRDTWRMFEDQPVFGWGFGCYGKVFMRYNTQSTTIDRTRRPYLDAHSDWLEALAELGWVGTTLLLGMAAGPIWLARRMIVRRAETGYAFLGAALLAAYAMVEFPFANPAVVLTFWCTLFYAARTAIINEMNRSH